MNETLKVDIDISTDISDKKRVLNEIRAKLMEIKAIKGITCVTAKQFNKDRGNWNTYGWGMGKGSTEIWIPLERGD